MMTAKRRKPSRSRGDRDRVIAYLKYAVKDVAKISASSAVLLVAAIASLQHKHTAKGNDIKRPS